MKMKQRILLYRSALILLGPHLCVAWIKSIPIIEHVGLSSTLSRTRLGAQDSNDCIPPGLTAVLPQNEDGSFGWNDEEFEAWILDEMIMEAPQLYGNYTQVFAKAAKCMVEWRKRFRGDSAIWKRLFKKERVVKEVIEAIPIIHAVDVWVQDRQRQQDDGPLAQDFTIIDLCSGKGYLSMMLSEYLPQNCKIEKFVLVDKAWPMCHAELLPHHINWEHIYGNKTDGSSYFSTWPIPLHTSKQNLKQSSTMRQLKRRLSNGPTLILGVHLCGTLSIQAIKLFHDLPQAKMMILKPCCLPGMVYADRQEHFEIGRYRFPTKAVCAPGKFRGKNWYGPPRWQLQGKFDKWCRYLFESFEGNDASMMSQLVEIPVQNKGGYQNTFLFAEKQPKSELLWGQVGLPYKGK